MRNLLKIFGVAALAIAAMLAFTPQIVFPAGASAPTISIPQPKPTDFRVVDLKKPYFLSLDTVVPITCITLPQALKGRDITTLTPEERKTVLIGSGTGTIIAHNRILTAHHVIAGSAFCGTAGGTVLLKTSFDDPDNDLAVLDGEIGPSAITTVACDGFTPGQSYLLFGYAQATDFALDIARFMEYHDVPSYEGGVKDVQVTNNKHAGVFIGAVTPGMSGGPVIGPDGRLYGIILATTSQISLMRSVADTALCTALKPSEAPPPAVAAATPTK